jgi:predicted RND superfamily exporter protein
MTMALLTAGASALLPQVGFEFDISELRPAELSYDDLDADQRAIAERSYSPVVLTYDSAADVARAHTMLSRAVADGQIDHVSGVLSVHSALPVDQAERVSLLQEIAVLARDPNVAYLPRAVQVNLTRIADSKPRVLTAADLPSSLRHVLGAVEGRHRLLLTTTDNMWDVRQNKELYDSVKAHAPDAEAAGEYLALAVLYELMESDGPRVASLALLAVMIMTWIDLRRFGRALGAVAALTAGMCWAGAALVLFEVKLSLVNFVGIPILMGIGVDVVIHLVHRLQEEGPGRVRHALSTTGWASGLSTATTVFSFAALSVASAQGVQSLGLLIVIGLTLVSVVALTAVPLGWMTLWRVRGDDPEGGAPPTG